MAGSTDFEMSAAAEEEAAELRDAAGGGDEQPWPSRKHAWWALTLLVLATMMNFFDAAVFGFMVEYVKRDFALSELALGLLLGPAGILFYVVVGIPLARLVDIYSRNIILSLGLVVTSGMTAIGGLTQSFSQLFVTRAFTGVGGSAHAPGTYSMIADLFPPKSLPRAFGVLQLGFILGNGLAPIIGGWAVQTVSVWQPTEVGPLLIRGWQWVLLATGVPGLIIAALIFLLREPPRRGKVTKGKALPISAVLREIHARRKVYYPLFIGLALTSLEGGGIIAWRIPFMMRTYGWGPAEIGAWAGLTAFISFPLGAVLGTFLTEKLGKKYKDAPVRATAIVFICLLPFSIASPMMPTGELSTIMVAIGGVFGMAGAVPQNTAIQTITPNEMRGQVTAIYLFMYTVFGAAGSFMLSLITVYVVGGPENIWMSMVFVVVLLLPLAIIAISLAIKPYGDEIRRLESIGTIKAA